MNSDIEEIKSRLNIVDVLRDYIRLEKAGSNFRANCPFHNEKTPSFMVSEDKQIWHCFGCQKGGDVFGFVMEIEGLEFKDALKLLAEKAGVELRKINPKTAAEKNRTLEILELATKFFDHQLWNGSGKIRILDYLHERGLRDETIKEFRLGYAPNGWRNILNFLINRGYKIEEILKTGLLVQGEGKQYDRFRDRIMFPIADANGKIVGYSARVAPGGDESQAKYVNTPETEVYHKSKMLYGIDKAKQEIRQKDSVLLVEGNMDAIASHQAGIKNVVAVSGTALTPDQISIIKRYTDNIKMFFDMDSAGESATKKSIKLCFEKDMSVQVVELSGGKDAADLVKNNPKALEEAVRNSKSAMEYFFGKVFSQYDKNKVEDKRIIAEELVGMIGNIANTVEKSHWLKKLGESLDIQESILTDLLKKASLKEKIERKSSVEKESVFIPVKKIDKLMEKMIGFMLVYPDVWRKIFAEEKNNRFFRENDFLKIVFEKGEKAGFDFDNLIKDMEDQEKIQRLEKIFFENKYQLGLDNSLEEIALENPWKESEGVLKEIKKEISREEIGKITKDLKRAEEQGDKDAVSYLREQFKNISRNLMD